MYNLSHFQEKDQQVIIDFIRRNSFAMLIGNADNKSYATQVPLLIDEKENKLQFTGHIMRKQDHQLAFAKNPDILVVFTGAHSYVSASWYDNPHQASTWNYMSVHARGILTFLDEAGLENALRRLTLHYENQDPGSPTIFDNLPDDYRKRLMKSIVAFEIDVYEIENVFKLSQNREATNYDHIIDKLSAQGADGSKIAEEMKKRKDQLYRKG